MIKWQFEGGESGSALARKRGEQRAYAGDAVYDEMLGEAKLISRGSSNAFLQIEVDTLGNKEVVPRVTSTWWCSARSAVWAGWARSTPSCATRTRPQQQQRQRLPQHGGRARAASPPPRRAVHVRVREAPH